MADKPKKDITDDELEGLPDLVKSMTMAIHRKGVSNTNTLDPFVQAFRIARQKLVDWGYLTPGSEAGGTETIRLTARGMARNSKHRGKGAGFDEFYKKFIHKTEAKLPEAQDRSGDTDTVRSEKTAEAILAGGTNAPPMDRANIKKDATKPVKPGLPPKARAPGRSAVPRNPKIK